MSLSLYEGKRRDLTPLKLLVTANVVLGLCAVLFWEPMSVLIADDMSKKAVEILKEAGFTVDVKVGKNWAETEPTE